jgi:tetratricopeptide (TPR) repeat protein
MNLAPSRIQRTPCPPPGRLRALSLLLAALLMLFCGPLAARAAKDDTPEALRKQAEETRRLEREMEKEKGPRVPPRTIPPAVQAHLARANRFYALGDYDAARVQYLEALKEDPKSPEAHYGLGMTYLASGDINSAIIVWRRAGGVDTVTANLFGEFRKFRAARDAVQSQLRATRRKQAQRLERSEEPVGERYVKGGVEGLFDASTRAMLGHLEVAAPSSGDDAGPAAGNSLEGQEALAPAPEGIAEEDLAQANLPRAASDLNLSVLDVSGEGGAEPPGREPTEEAPSPPVSGPEAKDPRARGLYYVQVGNNEAAIAAFEEVLKGQPEDTQALEYLGGLYLAEGHIDQAEEAYRKLAVLFPNESLPMTNLGGMYMNLGRFDEASEALQEALRRNPRDSLAMNNLAGVYYKTGRVDAAILELKRAIEINPKDLNAHNNLAGIYYRQERFDQAIAQLQKILNVDPNYGIAAANLEEAYKRKREFDAAKRLRKMRARQIVVSSRAEAQEIRQEIKDGNDFVRLAREKSLDPNGVNGGDIGFFSRGELDSRVEDAIKKLSPGEISGVVKTPAGYAIFQRLD